MRVPLTRTPLYEPRSSMATAPLARKIRACRRDTLRSVRRIVLPSLRPMVISSRIKGTTVVFPSSSWMTSLNIGFVPGSPSPRNGSAFLPWLYQARHRRDSRTAGVTSTPADAWLPEAHARTEDHWLAAPEFLHRLRL